MERGRARVGQVLSPSFGRLLTWSLGAAGVNDFLQAVQGTLRQANELEASSSSSRAHLRELRSGQSRRLRFCGRCGAPLVEAEPARETRKTVTIVFSDVTGSTALGERLDPETTRRVMRRYYEAMSGPIERHGGTVEKYIGDAVMAVFGIPTLHEDDALRAVRAAAEMRDALAGSTTSSSAISASGSRRGPA